MARNFGRPPGWQRDTNLTRVGAFQTVNLYVSYDLPNIGFARDTAISVHLDNIFDAAPSYENIAGGTGNGSTFGRYLSATIRKQFQVPARRFTQVVAAVTTM